MKQHDCHERLDEAGSRFDPFRQLDSASRRPLVRALAWVWSLAFAVSTLSIYSLGHIWLGHTLIVAGVCVAVVLFNRAESRRRQLQPVPYLSRGCNTVWKLDREG